MHYYFVRHGESEANRLRIISNRDLPHALTELGRKQAQTLAERLRDQSICAVYCSPILRARQTGEVLADAFDCPLTITDALREYDCGVWEGSDGAAGWAEYERVERCWRDGLQRERIEGGESLLQMRERFIPFIASLRRQSGDAPESVVLVGHGGLYRWMLPLLLSNVTADFACTHPIGHIDIIFAEDTSEGLLCRDWCGLPMSS